MYQNPPRYVPGPPLMSAPPQARRGRIVPFVLSFVIIGGLFFGVSYSVMPDAEVRVLPGFAFAGTSERSVLLVPYERHGPRGMFQVFTQDQFQVRLAAADPASGAVLWDTQLSDQLIWSASVLAAGERYAYLATDDGLVIVGMADGEVVARGAGVRGLGDAFVAAQAAYAYDPAGGRVLALNADGDVLAIPLDQTTAASVDAPTAAAWSARLTTGPLPAPVPATTAQEAALAPGSAEKVALQDLPLGIPGRMLVRPAPNGWDNPVGGATFRGGELVVVDGVAAGAASGHVLVEHQESVNDRDTTLSSVSLDSGQVIGSLPVPSGVDRVIAGSDGAVAVSGRDVLAVVLADGHVSDIEVGAVGFFGAPSEGD
jgi:hypothetical protein